jgi:hypothetical protein
MADLDGRIRILWIDDCEAADAGEYAYPESELPPDLREWFCVVRHPDIPGPSSIRTPEDFWPLFDCFWKRGQTDLFPVEIVAMDYNLRKWRDPSATAVRGDDGKDDYPGAGGGSDPVAAKQTGKASQPQLQAGFEGLVTGVFASAMLSAHPTGLVPMTNYGDALIGVPEVRALQNLSRPLLRVDYSDFHVSGDGRSWRNVLRKGVESLRDRMEILFVEGDISLSLDELMRISEGEANWLTLRSRYCTRRLPLQGLFLDADEGWREAARQWSTDLIKDIVKEGNLEALVESRRIAETLWDAYNDDDMFRRRCRLSELHDMRESLNEQQQDELKGLYQFFEVANPESNRASCGRNIADLRALGADAPTARWACLRVLVKLLARHLLCRKNWSEIMGEEFPALNLSNILVEDWMVALFPVAQSPLILPFQGGACSDYAVTAWGKWLRDNLKDDLSLNPRHILEGFGLGETIEGEKRGGCGLREAERRILREIAFDEPDLTERDWRESSLTQKVLWGRRPS